MGEIYANFAIYLLPVFRAVRRICGHCRHAYEKHLDRRGGRSRRRCLRRTHVSRQAQARAARSEATRLHGSRRAGRAFLRRKQRLNIRARLTRGAPFLII